MAIWQYHTKIVPKDEFEKKKDLYLKNKDQFFEEIEGWERDKFNTKVLKKYLKQKEHWLASSLLWGDEETTDVQLFIENNFVEEVSIRIDLRGKDTEGFIEMLLELAKENNGVIVNADNNIVPPTIQSIVEDIKNSPCYKFVSSPISFFGS